MDEHTSPATDDAAGTTGSTSSSFESPEVLRSLLIRLHDAGPGAWRGEPEAADLMRYTAIKYRPLARKHGLDAWAVASAAFEVMLAPSTRNAVNPWAVVTRAVQITCHAETRAAGMLTSASKVRHTARIIGFHDAVRFAERERLAEADVRLADAGRRPDWSAELLYGQREPTYSNMITLMFRVDLPIFQGGRQDLDVSSRAAASRAAALQSEEARRAYEAQIRGDLIDWQTAQARAARYEQSLLPLAEQRLAAAAAADRGGRGELKDVIEAQRMLADTRIGWHDALLERGRAWIALVTLVEGAQP